MSFVVKFDNPGTGCLSVREFDTREEAEARVEHYREKYGTFPGYKDAEMVELPEEQERHPCPQCGEMDCMEDTHDG